MFKIILGIGSIQAIAIAIQFIRSKMVAVTLGPEGVGVVSTIDQIVQLAAFAMAFSLPLASVRFLSKAHSEGDDAFRSCYIGFLKLLALVSLVGTVGTIALIFIRPEVLGSEIGKYQTYVAIALLSLPTIILSGFFMNVLAAAQNFRFSAFLAVLTNSVTTTAVVIGLFAFGLFGVFAGASFSGLLLTIAIIVYFAWRKNLGFGGPASNIFSELRKNPEIASFASMLYFSSITYSLSLLVARYAILSNFGEAEAGLLQGAIVLSVAIGMVLNPANGLYLTPLMNRGTETKEKLVTAVEFQRKMVMILGLVSLPVVLFPQLILTLIFSDKFTPVADLVYLFIIAQVITQLAGVHQAYLIGADDFKASTFLTAIGQFGFAALAWVLAPSYGIKGVALASIISGLMIFASTLLRMVIISKHSIVVGPIGLIAFTLIVLVIGGSVAPSISESSTMAALIKCAFLGLFGLSLFLFLTKTERSSIFGYGERLLFGR